MSNRSFRLERPAPFRNEPPAMSPTSAHRRAAPALLASLMLAACGGSGDDDASLVSMQAIDGYLVGASVYCDAEPYGGTTAAGRLICPAGTRLVRVENGSDVGFDPDATTGGTPFTGSLVAPTTLSQVTPLSTLAVEMASDENGFDPARFDDGVRSLAVALGQSSLDLSADAATVMQIVRLNAQMHQIASAFGPTTDDYRRATATIADVLVEGSVEGIAFDPADDATALLTRVNDRLMAEGSDAALSNEALARRVEQVGALNHAIADAGSPEPVSVLSADASEPRGAMTIDRSETALRIFTRPNLYSDVTLGDFENPEQLAGRHRTVISRGLEGLALGNHAFEINEDLDDERVEIGLELRSTLPGDRRVLSFTARDVRVSARAGDPSSLSLTLPEEAAVHARGVAENGVETRAVVRRSTRRVFRAENGSLSVSFDDIDEALREEGFDEITERSGNYRVTLAIAGMRIDERDGGVRFWPDLQTVDNGDDVVTGMGFVGYLTIDAGD